jgi:hypothetical protein
MDKNKNGELRELDSLEVKTGSSCMKSTKNKESSEQEKIIDPHGPATHNNSTRSNNIAIMENNKSSNINDYYRNLEENKGHPVQIVKENSNQSNNPNNIFVEEEEKKEIKKIENKKLIENNSKKDGNTIVVNNNKLKNNKEIEENKVKSKEKIKSSLLSVNDTGNLYVYMPNPQIPEEYLNDIHKALTAEESVIPSVFGYMKNHTDINEQMRAILIDWIIEVHSKFNLQEETLFLCVNIIDKYLKIETIPRSKLQLLGVSSIMIACKQEEIYSPSIRDFVFITDNAYSKQEIFEK